MNNKLTIFLANIADKKKVIKVKVWFNKTLDTSSGNFPNSTKRPAINKYIWEK